MAAIRRALFKRGAATATTAPVELKPLLPVSGQTRTGLPVSRNRAPHPDLAPYITRLFITTIDQPETQTTSDFLLNDTAFVRMLPRGYWEAELTAGEWTHFACPLLFGAQSRPLRVRVRGPIGTLGFALRPCGWRALFEPPAHALADRIAPLREEWPEQEDALELAGARIEDEAQAFALMEGAIRARLAARRHPQSDAAMSEFQRIADVNPVRPVGAVAAALGLSPKAFRNRVLGSFGHQPKVVLERARFLDQAAAMRGITMPSDEELAALRYYDQSHVTREMRRFAGMTPAQFRGTPTPLLTAGLEARQLRKAEEARRLPPGAQAPWLA